MSPLPLSRPASGLLLRGGARDCLHFDAGPGPLVAATQNQNDLQLRLQ